MPPKAKVCPHIKAINSAKFSNCLNNFESSRCSFKHPKHADSVGVYRLGISTSKYEIGCLDGTELECLKKLFKTNKKDCVVVVPTTGQILCYQCNEDLKEQYERLEDKEDKSVAMFVKAVEDITQKLHSSKIKAKMQTNPDLMEQVRPEKFKEISSVKHQKKEELIAPAQIFGIENIGNTCFFNSVMQCFNANRTLVDYYIKNAEKFAETTKEFRKKYFNINQRLSDFFIKGNNQGCTTVDPRELFNSLERINPIYSKKYQQDASEAYRYLVNGLVDGEVGMDPELDITPITALEYGGSSASELFCLHCNYRSLVFTPFFDIQLSLEPHRLSLAKDETDTDDITKLSKDVHADSKVEANANYTRIKQELDSLAEDGYVPLSKIDFEISEMNKGMITTEFYIPSPLGTRAPPKHASAKHDGSLYLEDVIYNNYRDDFLNNIDNFYKCSQCEKDRKPTEGEKRFIVRKSFLLQTPEVLVITFKRFKKSSDSLFSNYTKNGTKVHYGETLDMTPYFIKTDKKEKDIYTLEAVVCHNGNLSSGHYTAYAKHEIMGENSWFYFSDQYWKKVDIKDVIGSPSAFMLFYRRNRTEAPKTEEMGESN